MNSGPENGFPFQLNERFEIRAMRGEGGMGVVYEAWDLLRCRTVALKTIKRLDGEMRRGLMREFRSAADLLHHNLVRLYELIMDRDHYLLAMEMVRGRHFDSLRGGRGAEHPYLRYAMRQLASGVWVLHRAGRLHRNLKPSNVMIDTRGRVVILDLGLAVDAPRRQAQEAGEGKPVGTVPWIAPEQARGKATEASDWYAVGCMLFQCLTGALPSGDSADLSTLFAKAHRDAPSVFELMPDAPADLGVLCDELLRREPAMRPKGAEVLRRLGVEHIRKPRVRELDGAWLYQGLLGASATWPPCSRTWTGADRSP